MKDVFGDKKPNCVVLDEIDGALSGPEGKGAIDTILAIAKAGRSEESNKNKGEEKDTGSNADIDETGNKKRRKKTEQRLTRPLVCICNDLYAPSLR
jgi:chromosome transmission fidelity protein 18